MRLCCTQTKMYNNKLKHVQIANTFKYGYFGNWLVFFSLPADFCHLAASLIIVAVHFLLIVKINLLVKPFFFLGVQYRTQADS